jgi:poly-gamma-glutamate capsule biosynthesis protein CapA/YwtB (metallophosphatase superfamily)
MLIIEPDVFSIYGGIKPMRTRQDRYLKGKKVSRHRVIRHSIFGGVILSFMLVIGIVAYFPLAEDHQSTDDVNPNPKPERIETPAHPPEEPTHTTITMGFVGDIMLGGKVADLLEENGFDYPYRLMKPYIENSDIMVGNMESPVTERGIPQEKSYVFRTSPEALPAMAQAGFDLMTLGNNHMLDYGIIGLKDTLKEMNNAGILTVGAGLTSEEAYRPEIINKNGIRVAFVGASRVIPEPSWAAGKNKPGVAVTYDPKPVLTSIAKADREADLVVVLVHWGEEQSEIPNEDQRRLAYHYIDAGADLVIGSHPHVLQGVEWYKGKAIAYSLGNFIFSTSMNANTWNSGLLQATCDSSGQCSLRWIPVFTKWAQPRPLNPEEQASWKKKMDKLSADIP